MEHRLRRAESRKLLKVWPLAMIAVLSGCPEPDSDTDSDPTATSGAASDTATSSNSESASATATDPTSTTTGTTTSDTATTGESTGVSASTTDNTTTGGTTTDGTSTDGTTSDGTSSDGTTSDGTTSDGTTTDGTTSDGTTSDGTSSDGTTSDGTTTGGDVEPFFPPCDELAIGEPLTLDTLSEPNRRATPAPMVWDGQDLVLIRDDWNDVSNHCEIVFERRDSTGELLAPGLRDESKGNCQNNAALGYNPISDVFLLTQQVGLFVGVVGINSKGTILWEKQEWDVCNSTTTTIDVSARDDGFVVMGEQYSCSGVGPRHTSASYYTPEGVREYKLKTAKATAASGDAACNLPTCDRLITLRYGLENGSSGTYVQMGDLALGKLDVKKTKLNGSAYGGWDATGAVWNGEDWLTIRIEDVGQNHKAHIRRWHEDQGWTTNDTSFTSGGTPTEIELLWTGHDYVGVYAEWPDNNKGNPDDWYDVDIHYLLIGADGSLKQHEVFERSIGYGGYSPQLVALPGSIGLSWVRVSKDGNASTYSRHLSMIECAG